MPRKIDLDRPVSVYYNLHRKCYSIQQGGLVMDHASRVWLVNVKPRVRKAGQAKVRTTGRKNVHAFLTGHLMAYAPVGHASQGSMFQGREAELYYNPYKVDTFVEKTSRKPVERCGDVWLEPGAIYARTITYAGPASE